MKIQVNFQAQRSNSTISVTNHIELILETNLTTLSSDQKIGFFDKIENFCTGSITETISDENTSEFSSTEVKFHNDKKLHTFGHICHLM